MIRIKPNFYTKLSEIFQIESSGDHKSALKGMQKWRPLRI